MKPWNFSDYDVESEKLLALVRAGKKIATTGLYTEGQQLPKAGDIEHILDHAKNPVFTIELTEVRVLPFLEVDFNFARDEGEGDENIESWRASHRRVFREWSGGTFVDSDKVICTRFKLLK